MNPIYIWDLIFPSIFLLVQRYVYFVQISSGNWSVAPRLKVLFSNDNFLNMFHDENMTKSLNETYFL